MAANLRASWISARGNPELHRAKFQLLEEYRLKLRRAIDGATL